MDPTIKIMAEPQTDPNKCKFILEKVLVQGGSFLFKSKKEAQNSPLAEALFEVEEVGSVFVSANSITVTKKVEEEWRTVGPKIGIAIRKALASGKTLISDELRKNIPPPEELKKSVQQILDNQINPAVASHGGHIELLDVKNNDVFIRMMGGCQGCAMSQATLKQGVEETMRKEIPNIGAIYDTTDHAAGQNPYYQAP